MKYPLTLLAGPFRAFIQPTRRLFSQTSHVLILALAIGFAGVSCKSKARLAKLGPPASAGAAQPSAIASGASGSRSLRSFVTPAGPAFAILAGEGLGPVRFGATVATIERLMEGKCDELTDRHCRYIAAGIEYELKEGVVSGIVVYRHDRPVDGSPSKIWGRTQCAIPPDLTPRVIASYVHSHLGKPQSTETVPVGGPNRTALRETYPGLVIEYDRGEYTQELIVGSIRVIKLDNPPKATPAASSGRRRPAPEILH